MKISIAIPPVDRVSIAEIVIRGSEIGLSAEAFCGGASMTKMTVVVRDGVTVGVKYNPRPTTPMVFSGHEIGTPTGRTDLLKAIAEAVIAGTDILTAAEECGKSAGWFLG